MKKQIKTNVMRILETASLPFEPVYYDLKEEEFSGNRVAALLGVPEGQCLKTLTTKDDKGGYHVFVVPVDGELDLKKAATAAKVKKLEMLSVKDLLAVTGYIRGEVSPVGMKKPYPTFFDQSVESFDTVAVSAGKKGASVLVSPSAICEFLNGSFADVTRR